MSRWDPDAAHIVVVGHPFEGMECYGPFDNLRAAQDWHEQVGLADGLFDFEFNDIIPLNDPDKGLDV